MLEKSKCCGCRGCEQICPQKCIRMVEDEEGYLYPEINKENCVECGLCKKVCPMLQYESLNQNKENEFYKLISNDKELIKESTSGGAFTEITNNIIKKNQNKNYKIYGCAWQDDMTVKHVAVDDIKDIGILRKSKYIQSDIGNVYSQIDKELRNNYLIIFTGTPCQTVGLKMFLKVKNNRNMENLYTLDLICHGVPSGKVFLKYIEFLEKKYKSKIKSFSFRERMKVGNKVDSSCIKIEFENGKELKEYSFNNLYMLGFYRGNVFST